MLGFSLLSSLLIGSALGKAVSTFLVYSLGLNLYKTPGIPALSTELALSKSLDLADFALTLIFTVIYFIFIHYFIKSKNKLINIATLFFNLLIFLQIHFASYNLLYVFVFLATFNVLLVFSVKAKLKLNDFSDFNSERLVLIANGFLTGFYLLLLINNFTSTILPLAALALSPLFYLMLNIKLLKNPGHILLVFAIFAPTNILVLLAVGLFSALAILFTKLKNSNLTNFIYPIVIIILVTYNPLYYLGHFDSVEEGFWLGWLAGLRGGKVLYRDIAAYHPPLMIWALNFFEKLFGYTIENTRLALHLLQIAGISFYYLLTRRLLTKKFSILVVVLTAMSLTTIMVRNNVEIRLGVGLLSLAFIANPFVAGVVAAVALFTSVEVGVATIIAGSIGVFLVDRKKLIQYFAGLFVALIPLSGILILQGAFLPAIFQIGFYAQAFSQGYFNLALERATTSSFIHWHFVNQYISAYPFLWELARAGIIGTLLISVTFFRLKKLEIRDKLAISLAIFGLVIFRSALGRSDFYHLLFPLLVSIPLIFYALEKLNNKYLIPVFSILLVFVIARNIVNASFIESKLYGLQTYGKEVGEHEPVLTDDQNRLVQYTKERTSADDKIFVYPWNPELYLLTERPNASRFYTPYAFFTEAYQKEMISELQLTKPAIVIYNPEMQFGNLTPDTLPLVNRYILENFKEIKSFGNYKMLTNLTLAP